MNLKESCETMSSLEECPDCGEEFKRLASHQGSLNCISTQHKKKRRKESLRSVPNSEKAVEWLKESDYRVEELYRNPSSGNYKKRHYTTEQGIKALRRHIFINASRNGVRAEIKTRGDGYITCEITDQHKQFNEVMVVVPDQEVHIGRKRVMYLRDVIGDGPNLAFTTDDRRIGPVYSPEEAIEKIPQSKTELIATAV